MQSQSYILPIFTSDLDERGIKSTLEPDLNQGSCPSCRKVTRKTD